MEEIICKNIYKRRTDKNLTQEYMAEEMNVTQSYYSRIERGKKNITVKELLKISRVLNIMPEELFKCY